MSLRNKLNQYPVAAPAFAIVVLLGALVTLAFSSGLISSEPDFSPTDVYYWDVRDNTTFVASSDLGSPIEAPSGADNGVRAYLYACDQCDPGTWFGYLEKSVEVRGSNPMAAQMREGAADMFNTTETMIRSINDDENDWVLASSDAGIALQNRIMSECGSSEPTYCTPAGSD